ncbi:hypothetical protein [Jeotgalibacillus salarius]|uniref:Uncharacterized protein n=1 Tax=Jeotgalibacillus salarius TaxID=546023 RepID=A0A4Y8LHN6_9BACL|nr:hypothetical protein [Jeotgalibacillus salarius]TFE01134.1 hypothetical protein E2626_10770 [Jeotgalibacillus salarius]
MKNQSFNIDYLLTLSPAKMQLYLLAIGVSMSLTECSKIQQILKENRTCIQSLLSEMEQVIGRKRIKELLLKAASFL